MKKISILFLLLGLISHIKSQDLQFSDSTVISILTCSPGEEVYAKFGHTGIRVFDPTDGKDLVFNYGIFSFNADNFYYKFIKGETDYYLGVHPTSLFLPEYQERNSDVWEQQLNLTIAEKRNVINALLENYKPENRVYRYNFVFDNCATRPRDKVLSGINGHVQFTRNIESKTFRDWIGIYVGESSWLKFGIDLVFGMDADKSVSRYQSMFLPQELMGEFQMAKITEPGKTEKNLVKARNHLVSSVPTVTVTDRFWSTPLFITIVLFILGVLMSVVEFRKKIYFTLFDSLLLFITGFAGVIVFYLMFFSVHPLVHSNLNLLWLNPLNLVAAVVIWIKPWRMGMFFYQLINIFLLLVALLTFTLSFQVFNDAAFPLIALLFVRYSVWFVKTKHSLFKKAKTFFKSIFEK